MSSELYHTYRCSYCQYAIDGLRVRCTECTNFEICLLCFTNGAEIGCHRNNHSYQFVDSEALDVFGDRSGWSALEELSLLNAIEHYSFGNWKDISQHIGTRTADEVREEYTGRFLEGSIGSVTWPAVSDRRPVLRDLCHPDTGPLQPNMAARLPPLDIQPNQAQLLDYYPLRDDFEIEYDDLAETLVSSLTGITNDDDQLDLALKLAQVDMYVGRQRERERRHRLVRDYQLISKFFSQKAKPHKKSKKEERYSSAQDRLRPLCQFHTHGEHERFVGSVTGQRRLSRRLAELLRYRRFGITSFNQLLDFEKKKISRLSPIKTGGGELALMVQNKKKKKIKRKLSFSSKKIHNPRRAITRLNAELSHC